MRLYKMLSVLLTYPDQEFWYHLDKIESLVTELEATPEDKEALSGFLHNLRGRSLIELQEDYVQTFDLTPDNTLHLTHHLFEEQDRNRGPTLIHLSEYFKSSGYELVENELPDYLPLLLEYVSTLEDRISARFFLRETNPAVAIIAENLEKTSSPYASLLRIVERHGQTASLANVAAV